MLERIQEWASDLPPGTWIEGRGTYYQPMPSREELDAALPDHPVALRWSAHDTLANRKALEVSGIDRNTPNPPGGTIERGSDGEPTGVLREARHLLHLPVPTYEQTREAIPGTLRKLWLEQGVTSVYTMDSIDGVRAYQELRDRGDLPPVRLMLSYFIGRGRFDLDALLSTGLRTGWGDEWLKIGAIKIILDGVWGTTAATYKPHFGTTDNYGKLARTPEQLNEEVMRAHAAGWQIWIQAIRMHTIWAARSGFEEHIKGSIEVGKLADMVVLSKDPTTVAPEDLMSIKTDITIVDGEVVYERR